MHCVKKGDIVIICSVVIAFVLSMVLLVSFSAQGSRVVITQNSDVIYQQSIKKDTVVEIGTNTIVIKNGIVHMENATCKNQICVKSGKISKKGESIVCLPNKVIVEIK